MRGQIFARQINPFFYLSGALILNCLRPPWLELCNIARLFPFQVWAQFRVVIPKFYVPFRRRPSMDSHCHYVIRLSFTTPYAACQRRIQQINYRPRQVNLSLWKTKHQKLHHEGLICAKNQCVRYMFVIFPSYIFLLLYIQVQIFLWNTQHYS